MATPIQPGFYQDHAPAAPPPETGGGNNDWFSPAEQFITQQAAKIQLPSLPPEQPASPQQGPTGPEDDLASRWAALRPLNQMTALPTLEPNQPGRVADTIPQPVQNPQPAPPQQVTPDQQPFHIGLPSFDPNQLLQRVNQVVSLGRHLTGGILAPEIVYDLARSALPVDQVAAVVRFIQDNGGERDLVVSETQQMAHNITQAASSYLQGVGQREQQNIGQALQPYAQIKGDIEHGYVQKGLVDLMQQMFPDSHVQDLSVGAAAVLQDLTQPKDSSGSAFPESGTWVPGLGGVITNLQTGQVVTPYTPEWDQLQALNHLASVAPQVGQQDMNVSVEGQSAHTVTDIRNDLFAGGWITDPNRQGPLQQDEISAWRSYYDRQGGANVQLQLQMQGAGFGSDLPITGFFNPTNPDGTANETGQRWVSAQADYQRYNQQLNDYIGTHPSDAVWMRDVPYAAILLSWMNGDDQLAHQMLQRQFKDQTKTSITGGFKLGPVTPLTPAEIGLRSAMALATNAGASLNALPNTWIMANKIQEDPAWQALEKAVYQQMTPAEKQEYEFHLEHGAGEGFNVVMQATHNSALRDQMQTLAQKHLTEYGYFDASGAPLQATNKYLAGVVGILAHADPDPQTRQATETYLEEHPLVADAANMILTWKLVPGRFGSSTRGVVGESGVYARVAGGTGGVINPVVDEIWNAHNEGRAVDQTRIGGLLTAGTSHPHYNQVADFQPAQTAAKALDDFYPTRTFHIAGSPDELYRVQQSLAKGGIHGQSATLPVPFKNEPNDYVRSMANDYVKGRNLPVYGDHTPATISPQEGRRISDFYEQATDNPAAPQVQKAYQAFRDETNAQYDAAVKAGMKFEPWEKPGQPYKSSADMMKDVRDNHHLYYFKTGTEGTNAVHGALDAATNDKFRAIHDLFGHAQTGWQFGKNGEYNAFLEHSKMYSDDAVPAMASETLAQNAYVNFAEANEGKKLVDRSFPLQKATVVPQGIYGAALEKRGIAGGTPGLKVDAQLPWQFNRLAGAVANRGVKVLDESGNPDVGNIAYEGPTLTKGKLKDLVAQRLDTLNQQYPRMLTTRLSVPARLNNAIKGLAYNPKTAAVARNLLVQSFNGVIEHADPLSVDAFARTVDQVVHDPVLARSMKNEFTQAFTQGPKGYPQAESLIHQLSEHVETNYRFDSKAYQQTMLQRTGDASGFSVPTPEGGMPVERSIYPVELGGHSHYIPDFDAAVQRGDVPKWLADSSWRGSEKVQDAWKFLDEAGHGAVLNTSRALAKLNYWVYRKWATYLSPPFAGKVATKTAWTTLLGDVKASGKEWNVMNQGMAESPLGDRLLNEIVPREFHRDASAYFGNRNSVDNALVDALQRRSRDDVTKIYRDVYGQKLSTMLGPEEHAATGASLRHTIDETNQRIETFRNVPVGGEAEVEAKAALPKLDQQLVKLHNDLKAWQEDRVTPGNGGADAIKARLTDWLQSPAGQHFRSAIETQEKVPWDDVVNQSYITAAEAHLSNLWYDQPKISEAFIKGETDGRKLYDIAKNANELYDESGRATVPVTSLPEQAGKSAIGQVFAGLDDKASRASYFALVKSKEFAFRNLAAKYYNSLRPNVEAGVIDGDAAMAVSIYKARDMANDLYFDLSSSMLQVEKRLRVILPFVTKRRLFWQQMGSVVTQEPRVGMALSEVASHVEAMNRNENENNRDKLSFTLPFGILGFKAGSTVDMHLYNQFWVGQHGDEIENYALLHQAMNTVGLTHPDPASQFKSVFGYYPSASAPSDSLIPRFGDWWIWASNAAQMNGAFGSTKTLDELYKGMPPDLVAQHQRLTNAILAQSYREGNNLSPDDAAKTAFIDLLMHSTAKIGLPGAPGITPEEQVAAKAEIQQYWNAKTKPEVDALETKYPGLLSELRMTRDPNEFKQWLLGSAQAALIQKQFSEQVGTFEAGHKITDLITDKHAQEQLAQIKRVRDDAYAKLAEDYPIWGESHGYGYRDANGVWKSNDDVKRMLAQRGSTYELAPGDEGVAQQAQKLYTNFIDANNIVPVSKSDHDALLQVMQTYQSLDDAIARFEAMPETAQTDKTLADLKTQRSRFITQNQEMLDAYWPHGTKTTLELAREQYYKDIYTPWVAAQKPIFDQLDPSVNPWLTSKQKGVLEDQLTAIKNTFNQPFTLPQYPGTVFPAPERINWINKSPATQAENLARWQVTASHHPEWLTDFQRSLLTDPQLLGQAMSNWDRATYNLYISALRTAISGQSGFGGGSGGGTRQDKWRALMRASGREPNVFSHMTAGAVAPRAPGNVFAKAA